MNDNARKKSDDQETDAALSARLKDLGDRLDQKRLNQLSESAPEAPRTVDSSAVARGLRLSTELVAGVIVGAAIGWGLDHLLGISPWGFIVFLLLGFAAGILNLMRAAGMVAERKWPKGR
jgi:ATP synthase protein I